MSSNAARKLSASEPPRAPDENSGQKYSRMRETPPPLGVLAGSLEPEIKSFETQAHNIQQTVNRLSPEIISYIGRCILDDATDTRSIVPLTHVCQHLRDSIISTPCNWTLVSNQWEGLAALSLERAKAAPLNIRLDMHQPESTEHPRFRELLLSHIQYTRSLYATSVSTANLAQILPDFPKSMPNLRSLTLWNSIGERVDWPQLDPFDFSAHTLKDLSLRNIPLYPSFLSVGTLTELTLIDPKFDLHLDTLLNFLEENHSLENAHLWIGFSEPSLCRSRRQTPIGNRLRHLTIFCNGAMDGCALISNIPLQRGAALKVFYPRDARLADLLSVVPMTRLPNLFPSFMEYRFSSPQSIRLIGPDGSFSLESYAPMLWNHFKEFPPFPLDNIRELRLECRTASILPRLLQLSFPSLEVLVIDYDDNVSRVFSTLLPNPTFCPLLKTLAFLNCVITEDFMDELAQFASGREDTALASLNRIVIVGSNEGPPSAASIERLRKRVPVVEVMEGCGLPADLSLTVSPNTYT